MGRFQLETAYSNTFSHDDAQRTTSRPYPTILYADALKAWTDVAAQAYAAQNKIKSIINSYYAPSAASASKAAIPTLVVAQRRIDEVLQRSRIYKRELETQSKEAFHKASDAERMKFDRRMDIVMTALLKELDALKISRDYGLRSGLGIVQAQRSQKEMAYAKNIKMKAEAASSDLGPIFQRDLV